MFRVKYVGFEMDGHPEFTVYAVRPTEQGASDDVEFLIYTECWAYWSADDFEPIDPFNCFVERPQSGYGFGIDLPDEDEELFDTGVWLSKADLADLEPSDLED